MSNWHNDIDNKEYTENEIRALNPNVLYGAPFSPDGYTAILETPQPTVTELEVAVHTGTDIDVLGNRVRVWAVQNKFSTPEEVAAYLVQRKAEKVQSLKAHIATITKPRVTTGLGYDVDGGRDNKDDFFSKWEAMLDTDVTTVRDVDNQFHPNTTRAQMQTIYRAIVANGEAVLSWKWQKEIEIASCTTFAQLNAVVF